MGIIKKLNEMELVGGKINRDVYPVTATSAVYDKNNRSLDEILKDLEQGGGGEGGDIALASRTIIVFKSGDPNGDAPAAPQGGVWDLVTNEITGIKGGWSTNDKQTPPVWMSTGEFLATAPSNPTWTPPIRISGENGADGADGNNTEYIFCRTKNALTNPPAPKNNPNVSGFFEAPWTNHPEGVTTELQVEWICSRIKNKDTGKWENWQPVPGEGDAIEFAIWSKWGVNGKDGDGLEYIYFINDGSPIENPTPKSGNSWLIDTDEYQERGSYDGKEYIPKGWSDNPPKISSEKEKTNVWVSSRKYRKNPLDPNTKQPINNGEFSDKTMWGVFSNPVPWITFAESGISIRTLYIKKPLGEAPNKPIGDTPNDVGSDWSAIFPKYDSEKEAVWKIEAYVTWDNKFAEVDVTINGQITKVKGWQGPYICTGANGRDSIPRSYKSYIYRNYPGEVAPPTPETNMTIEEILSKGVWKDYPNDPKGNWWQCIGVVSGDTNKVKEWGSVIPLNGKDGKDGIAQDGKWTELRFKVSTSLVISLPLGHESDRNLDSYGWTIELPPKASNEYMFMTKALISPENTIIGRWDDPVRISGEKGPKGDAGPASTTPGPQGIPGVSIDVQYALGNANSRVGGWQNVVPNTTDEYQYVWCRQGKKRDDGSSTVWGDEFRLSGTNGLPGEDGSGVINLSIAENVDPDFSTSIHLTLKEWNEIAVNGYTRYWLNIINWKKLKIGDTAVINGTITDLGNSQCSLYGEILAIRKMGINDYGQAQIKTTSFLKGIQGKTGTKGQMIYPKGVYSKEDTYKLTETTAPYVWDPLFNAYYVYNSDTPWIGGYEPGDISQSPKTPGQSNTGPAGDKFWVKFEEFKAIFARVGIIANGLIGSAVFNGDYMFSQQGKGRNVLYKINGNSGWSDLNKKQGKATLMENGWSEDYKENSNLYYIEFNGEEWTNPLKTSAPISGVSSYELFSPDNVYNKYSLFDPNICIDFATGESWFARGEVYFDEFGHAKYNGDVKSNNAIFGDAKGKHVEIKGDSIYETALKLKNGNDIKAYLQFISNLANLTLRDKSEQYQSSLTPYTLDLINGSKEIVIDSKGELLSGNPGISLGNDCTIMGLAGLCSKKNYDVYVGAEGVVKSANNIILPTADSGNAGRIVFVKCVGNTTISSISPIMNSKDNNTSKSITFNSISLIFVSTGSEWITFNAG